jgi:hypothetical protein
MPDLFDPLYRASNEEITELLRVARGAQYWLAPNLDAEDELLVCGSAGSVKLRFHGEVVHENFHAGERAGQLIRLPGVHECEASDRVVRANAGMGFDRHLNS